MVHPGGPTSSALFLVVIVAAGLHFYCASSTSTSTPPSMFTSRTTKLADQTAAQSGSTSARTISVVTPLPTLPHAVTLNLTEQDTATVSSAPTPVVKVLTTAPLSGVLNITVSTASSSPQPSTGLQSTEDLVGRKTSVASQTNTVPHSDVMSATSPFIINASSTSAASTSMTNLNPVGVTQLPNTETSAVTVITSKKLPPKETTFEETPTASSFLGPTEGHTLSPVIPASKVTPEISRTDGTTFSSGVTVQEVQHALSSGSIAAITIAVIVVVLLVFGIAAFLKIRHSSYGRLLDDHDYGSWGNYNNPLYDDS